MSAGDLIDCAHCGGVPVLVPLGDIPTRSPLRELAAASNPWTCGAAARGVPDPLWFVKCWGCGVSMPGLTREAAVAAWNKRTPPTPITGEPTR